jgi:hypothetical protein
MDYVCADCQGTKWTLKIGHQSNGRTMLLIICSNEKCVQKKKAELNIDDTNSSHFPIWDEFDITGQGKDSNDLDDYCNERKLFN